MSTGKYIAEKDYISIPPGYCYSNVGKFFMLHFLFRHRCDVPYSECKATDHKAECVCKKDFKGNGTEECIPAGFTQEENGRLNYAFLNSFLI